MKLIDLASISIRFIGYWIFNRKKKFKKYCDEGMLYLCFAELLAC